MKGKGGVQPAATPVPEPAPPDQHPEHVPDTPMEETPYWEADGHQSAAFGHRGYPLPRA